MQDPLPQSLFNSDHLENAVWQPQGGRWYFFSFKKKGWAKLQKVGWGDCRVWWSIWSFFWESAYAAMHFVLVNTGRGVVLDFDWARVVVLQNTQRLCMPLCVSVCVHIWRTQFTKTQGFCSWVWYSFASENIDKLHSLPFSVSYSYVNTHMGLPEPRQKL